MKFTRLTIENFGTIESAEIDLDERGLVLLQGENRDDPSANSNGAGKSTIVEAISWALYGKTAKGVSGDAVINTKAGKNTRVSVRMLDGEHEYLITRHRKHSKGKNALHVHYLSDGEEMTDLTKGTDRLTQPVVDEIVGANHEVFVSAVYAGQEAMPNLPEMTDVKLKELIEEAAGITMLEQAYEIARARLRDVKNDLNEAERKSDLLEQKVDGAERRLDDTKHTVSTWENERDARIMDMESDARLSLGDAKKLREEIDKLPAKDKIERDLERANRTIESVSSEQTKRAKLEQASNTKANAAARSRTQAEGHAKSLKKLRDKLAAEKGRMGEPCPTCARPHDDRSLAASISSLTEECSECEREARAAIAQAKIDAKSASDAHTELEAFVASMTDLSHAIALRDDLTERADYRANKERLAAEARQKASDIVGHIKREKSKVNPYKERVAECEEDVKKTKKALKDHKAETKSLYRKMGIAQSAAEVFGPKGVRAHILDTVTPYLNERTANYLTSLSDGNIEAIWQTLTKRADGTLREKFSIQVTHKSGGSGFASLSGGEKRKVRVACALALQDLVATRATKPLDLWVGDEIDAALDTAGLERLMSVLEEKARIRGTVLIISHSDLKDWCRNQITIIKEDGASRVAA